MTTAGTNVTNESTKVGLDPDHSGHSYRARPLPKNYTKALQRHLYRRTYEVP